MVNKKEAAGRDYFSAVAASFGLFDVESADFHVFVQGYGESCGLVFVLAFNDTYGVFPVSYTHL